MQWKYDRFARGLIFLTAGFCLWAAYSMQSIVMYIVTGLLLVLWGYAHYRDWTDPIKDPTEYQIFQHRKWGNILLISFTSLIFIALVFEGRGGNPFLVLLFLGMLIVTLIRVLPSFKGRKEERRRPKDKEHGSSDWATKEEIKSSGNRDGKGLYLGDGHLRSRVGHILTTAGTRKGKGVSLIIPSLLVDPHGSYIVTDPKGENAHITARFQKSAGQNVYILDPWGEQQRLGATHGIESAGFNPFSFLKQDRDELIDNCEAVAMYLVPDNPQAKEPYWDNRARTMIKFFLLHIITAMPESDHNFWTLYKMLRYSGDLWAGLLFDLMHNEALDGLIAMAGHELVGIEKADVTMAGIVSHAQNATTIFESPQLRQSLQRNELDLNLIAEGNSTIYIVIPERFISTHSAWLRLVVGLSLKAVNKRPRKRVNFILDECGVMGKLNDITRGFAFAAGQNIVLWTFFQSLTQIRAIYGEDGMNTFIGNAAIIQAFGVTDNYTTEYISKLFGETTGSKTESSLSFTGEGYSTTKNTRTFGRRLIMPDEVSSFDGILMFAEGLRIKLRKVPYFKSRFAHIDPKDKQFLKFKREQEAKGLQIEWHGLFMKRADAPPRVYN